MHVNACTHISKSTEIMIYLGLCYSRLPLKTVHHMHTTEELPEELAPRANPVTDKATEAKLIYSLSSAFQKSMRFFQRKLLKFCEKKSNAVFCVWSDTGDDDKLQINFAWSKATLAC